jgi:hypothetical protein
LPYLLKKTLRVRLEQWHPLERAFLVQAATIAQILRFLCSGFLTWTLGQIAQMAAITREQCEIRADTKIPERLETFGY